MTGDNHRVARDFFAALSSGDVPDALVTDDMTAWTTTSGVQSDKARYQAGIKIFMSLFSGPLIYTVDSLTAEEDRVAAEVQSHGTLSNGETFHNIYVFMLRIRDGRICAIAEHMNPAPVQEKILPLLRAAMAKSAG